MILIHEDFNYFRHYEQRALVELMMGKPDSIKREACVFWTEIVYGTSL
jgi:hypothetical protein